MRVLAVEDHPRLATALASGLRAEGLAVDLAFDGNEALTHVRVNRYDVVVLDRDLPGAHGDEVCRAIVAEHSETRVLMLTAASTIRDRVEGLGLRYVELELGGADAEAAVPGTRAHLKGCPACSEDHHSLLAYLAAT